MYTNYNDFIEGRKSIKFPYIFGNGYEGVRWYSDNNPWMDCVVLVPKDKVNEVMEQVRKAIDEYWDEEFECYGDAIEEYVDYPIIFHDSEDESEEYESAWDEMLSTLKIHTV